MGWLEKDVNFKANVKDVDTFIISPFDQGVLPAAGTWAGVSLGGDNKRSEGSAFKKRFHDIVLGYRKSAEYDAIEVTVGKKWTSNYDASAFLVDLSEDDDQRKAGIKVGESWLIGDGVGSVFKTAGLPSIEFLGSSETKPSVERIDVIERVYSGCSSSGGCLRVKYTQNGCPKGYKYNGGRKLCTKDESVVLSMVKDVQQKLRGGFIRRF